MTPPPNRVSTKLPAVLLSPAPSPSPPPLSPPPPTQARHVASTHPIRKRGSETRHGKPILMKKTAVDRFNDSRQEESCRLNLKWKMEHDEKMASICLKRHKYDLRYGSASSGLGSTPQTPAGSSTPVFANTAATKEDKQIEILRLQIRLAELTRESRDNSAHASSSHAPSRASRASSSLSYHNDNSFMTSEGSGLYRHDVPSGEASDVGALADTMRNWPETYNFL